MKQKGKSTHPEFALVKLCIFITCNNVEIKISVSHARHGISGVMVSVAVVILYFNISTVPTHPVAAEPPFVPAPHLRNEIQGALKPRTREMYQIYV
jgi:hypothetical protein